MMSAYDGSKTFEDKTTTTTNNNNNIDYRPFLEHEDVDNDEDVACEKGGDFVEKNKTQKESSIKDGSTNNTVTPEDKVVAGSDMDAIETKENMGIDQVDQVEQVVNSKDGEKGTDDVTKDDNGDGSGSDRASRIANNDDVVESNVNNGDDMETRETADNDHVVIDQEETTNATREIESTFGTGKKIDDIANDNQNGEVVVDGADGKTFLLFLI